MRTCDEIAALLSASLDGELTAEEQAALDEHLAVCPACRALLEELRSLQTAAANMEEIPAPAGFAAAVMAAVAADPAQERADNVIPFASKMARKRRKNWTRWVASVAAMAVIAVGAASLPGMLGAKSDNAVLFDAAKSMTQDAASPETAADEDFALSSESKADTAMDGLSDVAPVEDTIPVEAAEDQVAADPVQALLESMTLREKLCQLMMVQPAALTGSATVLTADDALAQALTDLPVGGLLLDKSNMTDAQQLSALTAKVQELSAIPLLLACDEEGGRVNRLMSTVGTTWVDAMLTYEDAGLRTAYENAMTIAADLVNFGLNLDLAPVADVWSNPANTVIGDRAYSTDFALAADLVASAVEGFHAGGVACTLKHFPGHGDTSADSHYGSVYVEKTLDELRENELLPFRAGIAAGADAVMLGHLIVSDVSDEPVLFSHELVTGLLRQEMGFEGVIMTDSLQMQAMTDHYTSGEIAVRAIRAGVDLLLCPADPVEAVAALEQAVAEGAITEDRIDESVLRILTLKANYGLLG